MPAHNIACPLQTTTKVKLKEFSMCCFVCCDTCLIHLKIDSPRLADATPAIACYGYPAMHDLLVKRQSGFVDVKSRQDLENTLAMAPSPPLHSATLPQRTVITHWHQLRSAELCRHCHEARSATAGNSTAALVPAAEAEVCFGNVTADAQAGDLT